MAIPSLHDDPYIPWIDRVVYQIAHNFDRSLAFYVSSREFPIEQDDNFEYGGFNIYLQTKKGGQILLEKRIGIPRKSNQPTFIQQGIIIAIRTRKKGELSDLFFDMQHTADGKESDLVTVSFRSPSFPPQRVLNQYQQNQAYPKENVRADINQYIQSSAYAGLVRKSTILPTSINDLGANQTPTPQDDNIRSLRLSMLAPTDSNKINSDNPEDESSES